MVQKKSTVKSVTTVELQPEVVQLAGMGVDNVVTADLYDYAKNVKPGQFDVALLDTWQGTGEMVWQEEVVPLRRLLSPKVKEIYCWQEDVMLGQIWSGLFRAAAVDEASMFCRSCHCSKYAFVKAVRAQGLKTECIKDYRDFKAMLKAEEANRNDEDIKSLARIFINTIGTAYWESAFGKYWDEAVQSKAA
jgi:hypothetical protein